MIDEILLFKGADEDRNPVFKSIDVFHGKKPEKGGVHIKRAESLIQYNPFEYPRFLEGRPTGVYALREVLVKTGLSTINDGKPAKKAKAAPKAKAPAKTTAKTAAKPVAKAPAKPATSKRAKAAPKKATVADDFE